MNAIAFCFLISLPALEGLGMCLMDVITTYLYGSMDNDIYMKIPEGFKLPMQIIQSLVACTQSSYNDPCMD